mmetsp:Transcript_57636/g.137052  ORF Transcript_57636/g.137052 Transcript_57636/m.137052 type:complete len:217 (-) Transcript_57636:31-681(-)
MQAPAHAAEVTQDPFDVEARFHPAQISAMPPDRARLFNRLHASSKARQETGVVKTLLSVERDLIKSDILGERADLAEKMRASKSEREMRWTSMTQRNPLTMDLVAESQRIFENNRATERAEKREKRLLAKRTIEAHTAILRRATQEHDEHAVPHEERRMAHVNYKLSKALASIEKGNERTARVLHEKTKRRLRAEEVQFQRTMAGAYPADPWLRTF